MSPQRDIHRKTGSTPTPAQWRLPAAAAPHRRRESSRATRQGHDKIDNSFRQWLLVSRRKSVTALEMSFIMADSEPNRSTPCNDASDAEEIMSPRQTSVDAFPSAFTGHI